MSEHPLTLASYGQYDKIDWKKLTPKDLDKTNGSGENLLHYVAKAGLWYELPKTLKDKKYWTKTNAGTTIFMQAAQSPDMGWIDPNDLTEKEILKKNILGYSVISLAITHGNLKKIPKQSITDKVLKDLQKSKDRIVHLIAKENEIKRVPRSLLTEELLCLKDSEDQSVYHILADEGKLKDLPKSLLTVNGLTQRDNYNATPLLCMVDHEPELIPKELLTPEIMTQEQFGETPIHAWATGDRWMEMPLHLITKETLRTKSPYTLLYCLISQYDRNKAWRSDNNEIFTKMNRLFYKALKLGDKKDLLEVKSELEKCEHKVLPKGMNKTSDLIKAELTRRKFIKSFNKAEEPLDI
jgi:hypothetical protein